jgi:hypothetical protein
VAPLVRPALVNTAALAPELTALFRELRPVIVSARTALPALTSIVRGTVGLVSVLYPAGRELVPVVQILEAYTNEIVAALANLGAATQATNVQPNGEALHYLRALVPVGNETVFGYARRPGSNRHNAYTAPGGLGALATGGLKAFDCNNVGNPTPLPVLGSGAPPCMVQAPWTFRGKTAQYPRAEQEGP